MIYLALIAAANTALAAFLVYENRRLTYAVMARHAPDLAILEKAKKRHPTSNTESKAETAYHAWRNPTEGVGP